MIIPNKVYQAVIIGLSDTTDGKYKIYIPSLMAHDKNFRSCFAKNKASSYGKWMDPKTKEIKSIGTYIPLQIGMLVNVIFDTVNYNSGSIIGFHYDEIPLNKDDQENFYLFGKTKNGTQIYCDESRNITHIMHNKGVSNIIFFDDKISLSINEPSKAGTNNFSNVEIGQESIILKVGNTSLILDESGMQIRTKDNVWDFGNKDMSFKTDRYSIEANTFEVQARKIFVNGTDETHIKSTVTRVTGGQQLALNGNTVNVESNINTTIQTNGSLNLKALLNATIYCPTHIRVDTDGILTLTGNQTLLDGINTVVNGTFVGLNASTIGLDGQFLTNFGLGSSLSASALAAAYSIHYSMKAVDTTYTTLFHFGDAGTGMASNIMSETLPGVAQGAPNMLPVPGIVPRFDYINTTIKYMTTNFEVGNVGTIDYINSLNGNYLPNVYLKE